MSTITTAQEEIKLMMATVQQLEQYLAALKGQLEAAGTAKARTQKKAWDKPKREAAAWPKFFQRVSGVLRDAGKSFPEKKECMRFCSVLKGGKAYDAWTDAEILAERAAWDPAPIFIGDAGAVLAEPVAEKPKRPRGRPRKDEGVLARRLTPPGTPMHEEITIEDLE